MRIGFAASVSVASYFEETMGHSREQKAKNHQRIVALASRKFREKGLAGIGLAALMKRAGLTVGGFYKHFASRDTLVAEAMRAALAGHRAKLSASALAVPQRNYESVVDQYLSKSHRDNPATGCPLGALAGEIARSDKQTRSIVTDEARRSINALADLLRERGETDLPAARSRAILAYCALIGAITMARAVSDPHLSAEILKTVAQRLKNSAI